LTTQIQQIEISAVLVSREEILTSMEDMRKKCDELQKKFDVADYTPPQVSN
jgi:hypothetical protein